MDASRDGNNIATLLGISNVDGSTPVTLWADPVTHRLLVDLPGGGGLTLETNGVPNGSQTLLNLVQGTNMTITDDGLGNITFDATGGSGGQVNSVVGTLNRISVNSTDPVNPVVDISTNYVGQSSITTLGTVTTGTWQATPIADAYIASAATWNAKQTGSANLTSWAAITRAAGFDTFVAIPSSANLATLVTDETGSGALVFGTGPTIASPVFSGTITGTYTLGGTPTFPSTVVSTTGTQTLTNKRITRRLVTTNAPGATPTTNTDNVDIMKFTGLATAITSMTTNLSGTPVEGDMIQFQFLDNGTARAITWGASFGATTVALPTTTVISTLLRVGFQWNGSIWQCIAVA